MKMVMMIVDSGNTKDIKGMLQECDVPGYTEVPDVLGKGTTGQKGGSRAFPGSSTLFMVALEQDCVDMLTEKLRKHHESIGKSEGFKAFAFDVEELV
jgi:nitrogen regulatory protein PII